MRPCNPKVAADDAAHGARPLTPARSAILRYAPVGPTRFGLLSNVATRIDSTSASDSVRGAPGLGSINTAHPRDLS